MKRFISIGLFLVVIVISFSTGCSKLNPQTIEQSTLPIEVFFSSDSEIKDKIIEAINQSETAISIAMFAFTDDVVAKEIADALITRTKKAGVKIRLIVDAMQAGRFNSDEYLKDNGIDVITMTGKGSGKMHHKFIIFDNKKVMTGSYNISKYAEYFNNENVIFITDGAVVNKYIVEFSRLYQSKPEISRNKDK